MLPLLQFSEKSLNLMNLQTDRQIFWFSTINVSSTTELLLITVNMLKATLYFVTKITLPLQISENWEVDLQS